MNIDDEDELKRIMDDLAKGATHLVASPDTIERLRQKGLAIESKFITYEEYTETLYAERKKKAVERLRKLPKIDDSIADGMVATIVDDIRASYAFGVFSSTITSSIFLLEYAMRVRIFEEKLKVSPNYKWSKLEKMTMGVLIGELSRLNVITEEQKDKLLSFKNGTRNPYLHANFRKLAEGVVVSKLPGVNVNTGKVVEMKDVDAAEKRFLWWAAKRFFDKFWVQPVIDFCFGWTNTLLTNTRT